MPVSTLRDETGMTIRFLRAAMNAETVRAAATSHRPQKNETPH